jgi:hypothetical protein
MTTIRMVDGMGKTVSECMLSEATFIHELEVNDLPRGLYWIILESNEQMDTHAVMLR